jgi:hypothetical protein
LSRTSRVEVSKRDASPACAVNFQLRVSFRDLFLRTGRSSYLTRHGYLLLKIGRIGAARRGVAGGRHRTVPRSGQTRTHPGVSEPIPLPDCLRSLTHGPCASAGPRASESTSGGSTTGEPRALRAFRPTKFAITNGPRAPVISDTTRHACIHPRLASTQARVYMELVNWQSRPCAGSGRLLTHEVN